MNRYMFPFNQAEAAYLTTQYQSSLSTTFQAAILYSLKCYYDVLYLYRII